MRLLVTGGSGFIGQRVVSRAIAAGHEVVALVRSAAPRLKVAQLQRLAEDKAFDIAAARADLGFTSRPFAAGIREEARLLWS